MVHLLSLAVQAYSHVLEEVREQEEKDDGKQVPALKDEKGERERFLVAAKQTFVQEVQAATKRSEQKDGKKIGGNRERRGRV